MQNRANDGGIVRIEGDADLVRLPEEAAVARHLILARCPNLAALPDGLAVRKLEIVDCPKLAALPAGLRCNELVAAESNLTELPADIRIDFRLDLRNSARLGSLPADLNLPVLILRGCTALAGLPVNLRVTYLDVEGCPQLHSWPADIRVGCGHLNLAGTGFAGLPPGVRELARLDLRNCGRFRALPEGLEVRSWIDIGGAALTALPRSLAGVRIRWRGVSVTERIAFRPEQIAEGEILAETNAEVRRVMLERFGFDRFFERVQADELDRDRDPGGERRLLRLELPNDEPLVCLTMSCPSTARRYVLRVPPSMAKCRQAAAWLAGFDDPALYDPLVET